MEQITDAGRKVASDLAREYGFSQDAVIHMMQAMLRGRGGMAQFDHPEFAGSGQWMRGGMLMIGDMFNHSLKARVDGLCQAIAQRLGSLQSQPATAGSFQAQSSGGWAAAASMAPMAPMGGGAEPLFVADPRDTWWPAELGTPSAVGSQNDMSYAFFPIAGRLAIQSNGQVSVYDTGHHQIAGVSQQQGSGGAVVFATPAGTVSLSSLTSVGGGCQQQSSGGGSQQQSSHGGNQQQSSSGGMAAMGMQPMQPMGMAPMAGFESWWPAELGSPSATGAQNNLRYAWFADSGCLAVEQDGTLRLLDARNHPINGIAQASGSAEVRFSTPVGTVSLAELPPFPASGPSSATVPAPAPAPVEAAAPAGGTPTSSGDVISALERLGELKAKGVLSEAEFSQKKTELLSRL